MLTNSHKMDQFSICRTQQDLAPTSTIDLEKGCKNENSLLCAASNDPSKLESPATGQGAKQTKGPIHHAAEEIVFASKLNELLFSCRNTGSESEKDISAVSKAGPVPEIIGISKSKCKCMTQQKLKDKDILHNETADTFLSRSETDRSPTPLPAVTNNSTKSLMQAASTPYALLPKTITPVAQMPPAYEAIADNFPNPPDAQKSQIPAPTPSVEGFSDMQRSAHMSPNRATILMNAQNSPEQRSSMPCAHRDHSPLPADIALISHQSQTTSTNPDKTLVPAVNAPELEVDESPQPVANRKAQIKTKIASFSFVPGHLEDECFQQTGTQLANLATDNSNQVSSLNKAWEAVVRAKTGSLSACEVWRSTETCEIESDEEPVNRPPAGATFSGQQESLSVQPEFHPRAETGSQDIKTAKPASETWAIPTALKTESTFSPAADWAAPAPLGHSDADSPFNSSVICHQYQSQAAMASIKLSHPFQAQTADQRVNQMPDLTGDCGRNVETANQAMKTENKSWVDKVSSAAMSLLCKVKSIFRTGDKPPPQQQSPAVHHSAERTESIRRTPYQVAEAAPQTGSISLAAKVLSAAQSLFGKVKTLSRASDKQPPQKQTTAARSSGETNENVDMHKDSESASETARKSLVSKVSDAAKSLFSKVKFFFKTGDKDQPPKPPAGRRSAERTDIIDTTLYEASEASPETARKSLASMVSSEVSSAAQLLFGKVKSLFRASAKPQLQEHNTAANGSAETNENVYMTPNQVSTSESETASKSQVSKISSAAQSLFSKVKSFFAIGDTQSQQQTPAGPVSAVRTGIVDTTQYQALEASSESARKSWVSKASSTVQHLFGKVKSFCAYGTKLKQPAFLVQSSEEKSRCSNAETSPYQVSDDAEYDIFGNLRAVEVSSPGIVAAGKLFNSAGLADTPDVASSPRPSDHECQLVAPASDSDCKASVRSAPS